MQSFLAFSPIAGSPVRLVACALLGPMIALGAFASLIGHASAVGIVVVVVVAALALAPLVPQRVSVGPSALRLRWLTGAREIPFDRIASFDASKGGFAPFVLVTTDGARTAFLPVGWAADQSRAREACAPIATHLAARAG